MFRFIEGMPPDVLAIEAVGKVTHEDYRTILIPKAEAMMAKGPIKIIYVIGKEFSGYDLEALGMMAHSESSTGANSSESQWLPTRRGCELP